MLTLFALALASPPISADATLAICRPTLANKAGGEIQSLTVASARVAGSATTIDGDLTAFVGMGPPAAGSASTHHLIRAKYHFSCSVRGTRVQHATLTQP